MSTRRLAIGAIVFALFALASATNAQEMTTDAERSWRELRSSDDVKSKLMAERWYGVIKQQDWSDKSGKFKTSAKYLTHDPKLAWVRLRVIQGAGTKRVVKDVQIPIEKLSPACQARVRQISALSEKVAAAVEEEKSKAAEEKEGEAAGAMAEETVRGRGEVEGGEVAGGLAAVDTEDVTAEGGPRRGRRNRAAASRETPSSDSPAQEVAPVTNDGPPLPALLPPLPVRDLPVATPEVVAPPATDRSEDSAPSS